MFKTILVPVDLEDGGPWDRVLRVAGDTAKADGSDVHLLTVVPAAPSIISVYLPEPYELMAATKTKEALAELAAGLDAGAGTVTSTVHFGGVYQEILAHADKIGADLIILESHKPNVGDYLLGSNASRVVRHASCSVFVLR